MPHIVIEYTPNFPELPFDAMLASVTQELSGSPEVQDESDLKARVHCVDHFRVGLADQGRAFMHVTVRILAGRTPEGKKDFSTRVANGLLAHMPRMPEGLRAHLSVEVVDMDAGSYKKVLLA